MNKLKALFKPNKPKIDISKRFELLRDAINGTMSSFHMARDITTGKTVGLKLLDKDKTDEFEKRFKTLKKPTKGEISLNELIEHFFKRFFQSYALAFNKVFKRKGNLFYKPFKRREIDKGSYFTQAIIYVHANPVKHGLINDLRKWKWSSWNTYFSESQTKLSRQVVLEWFGGIDQFIRLHLEMTNNYCNEISIED